MSTARTKRLHTRAHLYWDGKMRGLNNLDAWKGATPNWEKFEKPDDKNSIHVLVYKFTHDPVVTRVGHERTQQVKVSHFNSAVRQQLEVIEDIEAARQENNLTAVAALHRVRTSIGGWGSERLSVSDDRGVSDKDLLTRIGALRPDLAPLLGEMLGVVYEPPSVQSSRPP